MNHKYEFHVHTIASKDSILTYPFILLLCKLKRIDGLAITDHNEIKNAIKYKKKLKKHNIDVVVGEEILTNKGEIIGLFLKEKIEPNMSPEETIEKIKSQNGIVYVPHPFDEKRYKTVLKEEVIKDNKDRIDFIEIHNGRNIENEYSLKQEAIQIKYGINPIIGSDAHTFFELGRNVIYTKKNVTKDNIVEEIKNAIFVKKDCIRISHTFTKIVKLLKMVLGGNWSEIHRIINRKFKKNM